MHPSQIRMIHAEPLDLPLTEPFAIATGTQYEARNVLVRVMLEDGTEGLGEAAPFPAVSGETQESTLEAIRAAAPLWKGQDARAWRPLSTLLGGALSDAPSARCGLEMALLDALARHHRLPLWAFFGGHGVALETDMTITAGDEAHAVASARAILARGITTFKVKIGALSPEEDARRLAAIHRIAPDARIVADANGGFSAVQVRRFLELLAGQQTPLSLLEQPVARADYDGLLESTRFCDAQGRGTLVCADESARAPADVLRLAADGAAHAVNIKLSKCGVVEALSMWHIARSAGMRLMIGEMVESVLATSFLVHFAAGLGGFDFVDLDTPMFFAHHPFVGGYLQDGARLDVGHVPAGHGVSLV